MTSPRAPSSWVGAEITGLRCQFRGDLSQRMASLTSESDSTPITGEEMQRHLSYHFFSLTTDTNRVSQNPRVPVAQQDAEQWSLGVRVHNFLLLAVCQFPFVSS